MELTNLCSSYFNGFQELSHFQHNKAQTNIAAALKVISYFTIVIPLAFGVTYGLASLFGRVSKPPTLSTVEKRVDDQAKNQLNSSLPKPNPLTPPVQQPPIGKEKAEESPLPRALDPKIVRSYTGDLTESQKSNLEAAFKDDKELEIKFKASSGFSVTIRRQDIFHSGAEVIVNAANSHLGGGGGIDGAIHAKGGNEYAKAHQELKKLYHSQYVSGYASLIESGLLKKNHAIDHVIVIAGPSGSATSQKENELYSCYYNSLVLAHSQNKTSIAFPSISTGIFGFPKDRAASISLKAMQDFISQFPDTALKTISIHFLPTEPKAELEKYQQAAS